MNKRKTVATIALMLFLATLTACQPKVNVIEETYTSETEAETSETDMTQEAIVFDQLVGPVSGDTVAIMHTSMGDIKIMFYLEMAPKTVENFTTHAKNGYYDGLIFHRVINDFMIQGGDPTGTGTGGESIWGDKFEDEISPYLFPLRGALCMANSGANTNGSQFFIVQLENADATTAEQMTAGGFPEIMVENYKKVGGTPWLYGAHTVFGQVFEGLDVLDAIAAVDVDGSDKPVKDVIIESIDIETY